jgi:hypothetical protein
MSAYERDPRARRRLRCLAAHVVCSPHSTSVAAAAAQTGTTVVEAQHLEDFASHTLDDVRVAWGREAGQRLVENGLPAVDDPSENMRLLDEASWAGRARKSTDMDGRHSE